MVLFLAVASNVFGAVFTRLGTSTLVAEWLTQLPLPDMAIFAVIMVLIFVLGWPFEWPAVILVFLPIFLPVIESLELGISPLEKLLWVVSVIAVNLQTAFLSPPVAMSAYYLRNVVPQWTLATIYRGMAEFMIVQIICLILVILWPAIALWLPSVLY
jgi:TRAP-type mannitol/chloroaromatic compound transport system permease large subunit